MHTDMIITQGTESDIDELERLYDSLNDYLSEHINYPGWRKGIYPVRFQAEQGVKTKTLFVARHRDRITGSIVLNQDPEKDPVNGSWMIDAADEEVYVVHTFVVHPDYFKLGIGKQLLDFADDLAKSNHIKTIRLDVFENNLPAIRLYEKCGYRFIDTVDIGLGHYGLDRFHLYEKVIV